MTNPSWARLVRLYEQGILALLNRPGAMADPRSLPQLVMGSAEFQDAAWRLAQNMVREVAKVNARSWREAAMKSTHARQIHTALQAEIRAGELAPELRAIATRNAGLIRSLPAEIAERVTAHAAVLEQHGARAVEIQREIRKLAPQMAKSRVRLIARTEISRAETQLTVVRSERIGIEWGQWLTSQDQRVRPSHRNLDRVLIKWNDPPQPEALIGEKSTLGRGLAGEFPNCRCLMAPIADLNEIHFPARVLMNGSIRSMNRNEFLTVAVGYRLAAA